MPSEAEAQIQNGSKGWGNGSLVKPYKREEHVKHLGMVIQACNERQRQENPWNSLARQSSLVGETPNQQEMLSERT